MFQAVKIVLCAFWCLLAGAANAQSVQSFDSIMNGIIRGTPGVTNVAVTNGVRTTASGTISVLAGSTSVPVATTASADIGYAAIARGASRVAVRAVPWIGTALLAAEVYNAVKGSGYTTCAPPAMFCKPTVAGQPLSPTRVQYTFAPTYVATSNPYRDDAVQACSDYAASASAFKQSDGSTLPWRVTVNPTSANAWTCTIHTDGRTGSSPPLQDFSPTDSPRVATQRNICADGSLPSNNSCGVVVDPNAQTVPATEDDIYAQLSAKANADHDWAVAMKAKMDAMNAQNPGLEPPIDVKALPLTVTAPPVSSTPVVVSTETIPNADGSTSTKKVTETTTVTPVVSSPSTVSSPGVTFPSTTQQTTTITNNTTNVTTTTVKNITNPVAAPAPAKQADLPTDYNRESTQQKVLDALTTPNTDPLPTGDSDLKAIKDKSDAGSSTVDGITESSTGLKSWLPTIKTAACVNPTVPIPIVGGTKAVPICDTVDVFSKFISAVISVFALYGCIREVQAAMKA
jgi:hypothetical protein